MSFNVPEQYRIKQGPRASSAASGNNGAFIVPCRVGREKNTKLYVIASDGEHWEHVSVTVYNANRDPQWAEMCFIKDLFWGAGDCVVQYHPPQASYVNQHKHCLHLWRSTDMILPIPADYLVGADSRERQEDLLYNYMGVLTPAQQAQRNRIANNMIARGGSFVRQLGELLARADPDNMRKIRQMFAGYWEQYDQPAPTPKPKPQDNE